jgi:hypothetical protein
MAPRPFHHPGRGPYPVDGSDVLTGDRCPDRRVPRLLALQHRSAPRSPRLSRFDHRRSPTPSVGVMDDSNRMRDQPALTTTRGDAWVVIGGITAALLVGMYALLGTVQPVIAWGTAATVLLVYAAMVIVRTRGTAGRRRLRSLAALYGAMVALSLVAVLVLVGVAWTGTGR